jgi:hypothetical protein
MAIAKSLLAGCLGTVIGMMAMSCQVEEYKKEKAEAETAPKVVSDEAMRDLENTNKQLRLEISRLEKELAIIKNMKMGEGTLSVTNERTTDKVIPEERIQESKVRSTNGFVYHNVTFKQQYLIAEIYEAIGEITNHSGKYYVSAHFTLSLYDKDGRLVDTANINIQNFGNSQTRSFSTTIHVVPASIGSFKIDFYAGYDF